MRRATLLVVAFALVLASRSSAWATSIGPGIWYEFSFNEFFGTASGCRPADPLGLVCEPSSGTSTVFAGAPGWDFVAPPGGATFTLTDAFLRGERFAVVDFSKSVGGTPAVSVGPTCGNDPVPCLLDNTVSHAVFSLAPGPHHLRISAYSFVGGTSDGTPLAPYGGAAYFRWDPGSEAVVPEPSGLMIVGLGGLSLMRYYRARRKRQ